MKILKTEINLQSFMLVLFLLVNFSQYSSGDTGETSDRYFKKTITGDFEAITEQVKIALKDNGFSVITEIDMDKKINEKLNKDLKPYKILGACNPGFAYESLMLDENIGVFLPCKIIVKQLEGNNIEVVSINPSVLMSMLNNPDLSQIAQQVSMRLKKVVEGL